MVTVTDTNSYIARRRAFAQAIEACQQLILDYETHFNGPTYNEAEIEAVKTAIVRIQCAEAADKHKRENG